MTSTLRKERCIKNSKLIANIIITLNQNLLLILPILGKKRELYQSWSGSQTTPLYDGVSEHDQDGSKRPRVERVEVDCSPGVRKRFSPPGLKGARDAYKEAT